MDELELDVPPPSRKALEALQLLSKKWQPIVLVVLTHRGAMGFNELLDSIPDVSGKVLSDTLESLQDAALVERRVVSESPLRVEYELTAAGRDMQPIFEALAEWGERHLESAIPRVLVADADRRLTDMYRQWLRERYAVALAHDGDELEARFDASVDVLVLDHELPGTDSAEVVARRRDDCRTILLVGDRPDFDLLEVECDDLLRTPIVRETALAAIDEQLERQGESADRRARASLVARKSLFEELYSDEALAANDAYHGLSNRLEELDDVE